MTLNGSASRGTISPRASVANIKRYNLHSVFSK